MQITYFAHSGFAVETESAQLIFDYYRGALPMCPHGKKRVFFVSHYHDDHYNRAIFDYASGHDTFYVLDSTVRTAPKLPNVTYVTANKAYDIDGMYVRTLRSTDCGVAFLVKLDGKTVYHAGDLHLWVWDGALKSQNLAMRREFESQLALIAGETIDAAFLPVDPRQGTDGTLGAAYALEKLNIKYAFPMHFWGDDGYARDFCESLEQVYPKTKLIPLTNDGESTEIDC